MMTWMDSYYSCSFDTLPEDEDSYAHTFFEIDRFKITRYHNSSDGHSHSQVLAEEYWPVKHSKILKHCILDCLPLGRSLINKITYSLKWGLTVLV